MFYRVQEWLADRTRMQYPRIRRVQVVDQKPAWGSNFSLLNKIILALLGLPLLLVGLFGVAASLFLLWIIVSAILGI